MAWYSQGSLYSHRMASERTGKPNVTSPDSADWRRLRLWHIQPVRDVLVLAMVFGILYLGYVLSPITVPMLLALLLAYLFEPLVKKMIRSRRISRASAALIIIASMFFVFVVPVGLAVGVGIGQAVGLVQTVADNTRRLISVVTANEPAEQERLIKTLPRGWQGLGKELKEFREHIPKKNAPDTPPPTPDQPEPSPDAEAADSSPATNAPTAEGASTDDAAAHPDDPDAAIEEPEAEKPPEWKLQAYTTLYQGIEWVRTNADNLAKAIGEQAIVTGQGAIVTVVGFLGAIAFLGFSAFLTAFFFFFFCTGWGRVLDFWTGLIPERKKGRAFDLIAKMDRVIAGFVRGRLTICAIMMLVFTVAYWLIGVPVPFIIGPLVGLLFMVPFLHVLSIPIGIILLWLQPSSLEFQNTWWWIIFAPIAVDVLGQFLDDWVLSPIIQGKTTEMDMPTILFASMAGGALAGMYGLLVAIPVAACIRILVKELFWPKFRRWARGEERDFLPISSSEEAAKSQKTHEK